MVMLGSPVWKGMGADIEQLRAILKVRLMLDDRKPRALGQAAKQKKEVKNSTILNFFLFLVTGFMYMFPIAWYLSWSEEWFLQIHHRDINWLLME